MKYIVDTIAEQPLDWSAKGSARVLQNVYNLLNTYKYEVAYDRLIGLDAGIIDKPMSQVGGLLTAQIIEQVERFEPRAKISDVEILGQGMGDVSIKVVVEID